MLCYKVSKYTCDLFHNCGNNGEIIHIKHGDRGQKKFKLLKKFKLIKNENR